MKLSISEAARRAGVRRPTIYRKIENGRLSKEIGEDGNPVIDLAELTRIYPNAATVINDQILHVDTHKKGNDNQPLLDLVAILKQDKERLTAELDRQRIEAQADLERERETINDLRRRLDSDGEERRRATAQLTAILTDRREKTPAPRKWFNW